MEKRKIGSLEVSIVGLGCNNFGRRIDEARTKQVVDAAIAEGINFFDTADIYGGTKSEEFLGRALGSRRKDVVVATKFGMEIDAQRKGSRPEYVKQACDDSLRRLGTDVIDLYQQHEPDPSVPIAETLGALDDLVKAGKVREIGCSNFSVEQLKEAEVAARPGGAKFVSVQNEYSLLKREPEKGVLAACDVLGLAFIPFFPLYSGLLTGKYRKGQPLPSGTRIEEGSDRLSDKNLELVEKLNAFAEKHGHTLLQLAFSYLVSKPEVSSVIAGATSPEQVKANAMAPTWTFGDTELRELMEILGPA
ncbi:MAG: hypothetical protein QOJ65_898 [Fimbriimonadaceae bacterium]|jgi:aryl-alcohol dehydrogenase-like predicted oxidoreductase|nr:hypothetical protein [Fimbriimonadaceae bacterium]